MSSFRDNDFVTKVPPVSKMWRLVNTGGIEIDTTTDPHVWYAGRAIDMLRIHSRPEDPYNGVLLVGMAASGVWMINDSSGEAKPLSMDWENTYVTCLASGPDSPHHIFAGCGNSDDYPGSYGGALYETDRSHPDPFNKPWRKVPLNGISGDKVGSIFDIAVLKQQRIIVLACWGGIIWSHIPTAGGVYKWQQANWDDPAIDTNNPPACFSVALGPHGSIVVGAYDGNKDSPRRGIFTGSFWISGTAAWLSMGRSSILRETEMNRVSIASCENQPDYVYALCTDDNGNPIMILRSTSGGGHWEECKDKISPVPVTERQSVFQYYGITGNECGGIMHRISVSPTDPMAVAFGIETPFASFNGGESWQLLRTWDYTTDPRSKHVHGDIHLIYFDPLFVGNLFILSDGGVTSTIDGGSNFTSIYNEHMPNLQFYGTFRGAFYGKACGSYVPPNLIGGGLQDNGNVYCELGKHQSRAKSWNQLHEDDGGQMLTIRLADAGVVIHEFNGGNKEDARPRFATWDRTENKLVGKVGDKDDNKYLIPVRSSDGTPLSDSLPVVIMETIVDPQFRREGQLMYAVAAALDKVPNTTANVFGLFVDSDGNDIHWEPIIDPSWNDLEDHHEGIKAVGSRSGKRVFLSTSKPVTAIYTFKPSNGIVEGPLSLPSGLIGSLAALPEGGWINRFAIGNNDTIVYATYNIPGFTEKYQEGRGFLIRTVDGGKNWERITDLPEKLLTGIDYDDTTMPATIYVATEKGVYVSKDDGNTWSDFSDGLPKDPHCADLRFIYRPSEGTKYLYLATYGWSVWRVQLS